MMNVLFVGIESFCDIELFNYYVEVVVEGDLFEYVFVLLCVCSCDNVCMLV